MKLKGEYKPAQNAKGRVARVIAEMRARCAARFGHVRRERIRAEMLRLDAEKGNQ